MRDKNQQSNIQRICKRCDGEMEKGFIGAKTNSDGEIREEWGTGISFLGTGLDKSIPVTVYRCTQCGRLESYAL